MVKRSRAESVLILIASFCSIYFGGSLFYATGVLHIALLQRYDQSVTLTAWLGSLFASVFALAGPLASAVINRFSCRVCVVLGGILNLLGFALSAFCENFDLLFLTYGIIAGVGQCFSYTGSVVALGFHFDKHRTLATGIGVTGCGVAIITLPPLSQILVNSYGYRGSFMLLGAIGFQTSAFGALLRPHSQELKRKNEIGPQTLQIGCTTLCRTLVEYVNILRNVSFLLYLLSIFSWCVSLAINVLYLPDYYHHNGSPLVEAALMMSAMGLGSLISRILTGLAAVDGGIDAKTLYFGSYGLLGIITCLLPAFVIHYIGKFFYSIILGLYSGGTWSLLSAICVEIVGIQNIATAFGLVMFVAGVGFLVGPVVGGLMETVFGSFGYIFVFSGVMFLLASVLGLLMSAFVPAKTTDQDYVGSSDKEEKSQHEKDETESFLSGNSDAV